jgi:arabinogalactan oligomer/maltooligosaccharide transport system permease protein
MKRPSAIVWLLAHALVLVASVVALYPVAWVVVMAITPSQTWTGGILPWTSSPSADNFMDLFRAEGFARVLANSLIVSSATALAGLAFATTAAWTLSRRALPGRDAVLGGFVLTQMFPGVVMAIPLYLLLDAAGLLDRLLGLVLVYATTSIPFATWTLKGWFDTLPRDLEEAAALDGASRWTIFVRIVLPLVRPALAVTGLFCFLNAWNEFVLAATLLSAPSSFTLPVVLQRFVGDQGTEWGHFAAGSMLTSLPVVALFFSLQRHFVSGLTAGAVKG